MNNTFEINYIGNTYTFNYNTEDTPEDFYHICWLIAKQQPRNPKEFEKASQTANLWYYQQKYKCRYSGVLQKNIQELDNLSIEL
jgi:hypothetical protein